jgi:Ca-activated chloride channel family protein
MRFGEPMWFWAFAALPLIFILYVRLSILREKALSSFAEKRLMNRLLPEESFSFRPLKVLLFMLGYSFLVIALTRPQFGVKSEMIERKGVDVIVALDISRSMLAEDVVPNRLRRAKFEIEKMIDLLGGNRVGLVVFAGESFVQCPLTLDYGAAKMFLDAVNTDWINTQGTDISGAIQLAQKSFPTTNKAGKVLILISDGEEQQGNAKAAAEAAAQSGVTIYTIGVGSEDGVPIPVYKSGGNISYKKDKKGEIVLTKLNPKMLEEVSHYGGGKYFSAGVNLNLTEIYKEISQMQKASFGEGREIHYNEQYQIFLLLALLLFIADFILPDYIQKKRIWRGRFA